MDPPRRRPEEPDHPFVGTITFQGLVVDVETGADQIRSGVDKAGNRWSVRLPWPYGEIRGTKAVDGDAVDAFVGPNPFASHAWVVQTKFPRRKQFDEPKVMLGFNTCDDAMDAFHAAYTGDGWVLSVQRWPMPALLEALRHADLQAGRLGPRALDQIKARMRKGGAGRVYLVVRMRKGEQLGLFGTHPVTVRAHTRKTKHGRSLVTQHQRQIQLDLLPTHVDTRYAPNQEVEMVDGNGSEKAEQSGKKLSELISDESLSTPGTLPRLFPIGSRIVTPDEEYVVRGFEARKGKPTGWLLTDKGPVNPRSDRAADFRVEPPAPKAPPVAAPAPAPVAAPTERDQRIAAKMRERYGDAVGPNPAGYEEASILVDREMEAEKATHSRKETLKLSTGSEGRKVGDVLHLNKREWVTVVRAGKVRRQTMTENDEDQGNGYEGELRTSQEVTVRPATIDEAAAEGLRRQAVADAKDAPRKGVSDLRAKLRTDAWLPQLTAPEGVTWDKEPAAKDVGGPNLHGDRIRRGTLPDGTEVWHDSFTGGDDWRDTYYVPRTAAAATAEHTKQRAQLFHWIEAGGMESGRKALQSRKALTEADLVPKTDIERLQVATGELNARMIGETRAAIERLAAADFVPAEAVGGIRTVMHLPMPVDPEHPDRVTSWLQGYYFNNFDAPGARQLADRILRAKPGEVIDRKVEAALEKASRSGSTSWSALRELETEAHARGSLETYGAAIAAAQDKALLQQGRMMSLDKKTRLKEAVAQANMQKLGPDQLEILRRHLQEHPEAADDLSARAVKTLQELHGIAPGPARAAVISEPAPAPAATPAPKGGGFAQAFGAAFDQLRAERGANLVTLHALRTALPHLSREQFDRELYELRRGNHYVLNVAEGRHNKPGPDVFDAAIQEGDRKFVYASRREAAEPHAAPVHEHREEPATPTTPASAGSHGRAEGSFKKLRDGSWGAKVPGTVGTGDQILVRKASGEVTTHKVRRVLYSTDDGHTVVTLH